MQATDADPAHPYREAWDTRDLNAWRQAMAPDVVLHSPVVSLPFRGREDAVELFGILFETFGDFTITHEFANGDWHAFFWRGDIGRRTIRGADLIRSGEDGKVREVTVLIRPLVDIATFAAAVGPRLAGRRGWVHAAVLRILSAPLRSMLALVDRMATRLT